MPDLPVCTYSGVGALMEEIPPYQTALRLNPSLNYPPSISGVVHAVNKGS